MTISFLCLAVFVSKTVWYDSRVAFKAHGGVDMPLMLMRYAFCLAPFVLYALSGRTRSLGLSRLIMGYILLNVYGLILALLVDPGSWRYVVHDTFKLTLVPTGFLLFCTGPSNVGFSLTLRRLANLILVYQLARLVMFGLLIEDVTRFHYGVICDIFPFAYYLSQLLFGDRKHRIHPVWFLLLAVLILFLGSKRTLVLCAVVVCAYLYLCPWGTYTKRASKNFFLLIAGLLVVALIVPMVPGLMSHEALSDFGRGYERDNLTVELGQKAARHREVILVYEELVDAGWTGFVFGCGHGATFEEEIPHFTTGEYTKHSIHFTPAGMVYRYGAFGLAIYLATIGAVVFGSWGRRLMKQQPADVLAIRSYGLAAFVASWALFGVVDDLLLGAFLGMLYRDAKAQSQNWPNGR